MMCVAMPKIKRFAPGDLAGWRAMYDVMGRCRDALRPAGDGDLWIGAPPSRDQIEARLRGDEEAINLPLQLVDGRVCRNLSQR